MRGKLWREVKKVRWESDADIKTRVWHVYHCWRRRLVSVF